MGLSFGRARVGWPAALFMLLIGCSTAPGARDGTAAVSHPSLSAVLDGLATERSTWENRRPRNWPDLSTAARDAEAARLADWRRQLAGVQPQGLPDHARIEYDLLTLVLDDRAQRLAFGHHLMPLNAEGGFLTGVLYGLRNAPADSAAERADLLAKLRALPAYLAARQADLRAGMARGLVVPRHIVNLSLATLDNTLAETPVADSLLWALRELPSDHADRRAARQVLEAEVIPAYVALREFLDGAYREAARNGLGATELPGGDAYYAQRVRFFTTLDIEADAVFALGEREVARIRAAMQAVLDELDFSGTFASFLDYLRTDPQFYAASPEDLLARAAWLSKQAEALLPRYFGKLPRMPFTVAPVPAAIAPTYTAGRYLDGSYEQQRPGTYLVNTYALDTRGLYLLPALTLHEAVPGHHLQIMLARELPGASEFRRNTYLSAFGEGWGLYAEWLGGEAGFYRTPYERFGQLSYEMWRACRLVVDVGLHARGWTRQQAVDYMARNTALSLHEVNTEIDRYIGWPGQALAYKMGELTIRRLRAEAEAALGDDFDLRAFHDLVLGNGSVPLTTLERLVRQWVASLG